MAEVAVHLTIATLPDDYVMLTIYIPDDISLQKISTPSLPEEWNIYPIPSFTQTIGDQL